MEPITDTDIDQALEHSTPTTEPPPIESEDNKALSIANREERLSLASSITLESGSMKVPNAAALFWLATQFAMSGMFGQQVDTPIKGFAILSYAADLGISPTQALSCIMIQDGKPSLYGDSTLMLAYRSGKMAGFKEEMVMDGAAVDRLPEGDIKDWPDGFGFRCTIKRKDMDTVFVNTYLVGDARRAGLWNKHTRSNRPTAWVTTPQRMLRYRCRHPALRDALADVLMGAHGAEEYDSYGVEDVTDRKPFAPELMSVAEKKRAEIEAKQAADPGEPTLLDVPAGDE